MRGRNTKPQRLPAQFCDTRIQQELFSSRLPNAIPVELHLDPPVLVDVDLLAGHAGDNRGLQALNDRLRRHTRRPVSHRQRQAGEVVRVAEPAEVSPIS